MSTNELVAERPELPKFDELLKLAQHNPEALEELRQQHISALIDSAPAEYQNRLRGIQFQIDAQRQIHSESPLGACVKISKMMHESFAELRGYLNQFSGQHDPLRSIAEESESVEAKPADILAFPRT